MIIERLAARWVFHSKQLVIVHLDEKGSSNTNGNPFWVLRSLSMILCCLVRLVLFFFFFILSTPPPEVLRLFYPALLLTWVHILPFFSALCASKREALVGGWAMSCVSSVCSPPVLSLSPHYFPSYLRSLSSRNGMLPHTIEGPIPLRFMTQEASSFHWPFLFCHGSRQLRFSFTFQDVDGENLSEDSAVDHNFRLPLLRLENDLSLYLIIQNDAVRQSAIANGQ
jgi:hypothetical protein